MVRVRERQRRWMFSIVLLLAFASLCLGTKWWFWCHGTPLRIMAIDLSTGQVGFAWGGLMGHTEAIYFPNTTSRLIGRSSKNPDWHYLIRRAYDRRTAHADNSIRAEYYRATRAIERLERHDVLDGEGWLALRQVVRAWLDQKPGRASSFSERWASLPSVSTMRAGEGEDWHMSWRWRQIAEFAYLLGGLYLAQVEGEPIKQLTDDHVYSVAECWVLTESSTQGVLASDCLAWIELMIQDENRIEH